MVTSCRAVQGIGISDEDVTRILDRLDAMECRTNISERRSDRRYLRGTAIITNMSLPGFTMADYRVRLRNVSQHGVCFLTRHSWEAGTRFEIQLPIGSNLDIVDHKAVVVRCRHVEGPICEIGAEFTS